MPNGVTHKYNIEMKRKQLEPSVPSGVTRISKKTTCNRTSPSVARGVTRT